MSVEVDFGLQYHRKPEDILFGASLPYLLVYADDQELDEPNSLAQTLQRYDPEEEKESPHRSLLHAKLGSKDHVRREVPSLPYSIQNNELPEVEYRPSGSMKEDSFETAYHALKPIKPTLGGGRGKK